MVTKTLRTRLDDNGDPWFVAKDVCDILGIRSDNAKRTLEDDEYMMVDPSTIGVNVNAPHGVMLVTEPGLYNLIGKSRKPEAKAFRYWINHEVLPSIRKHGMYATENTVEAMLNDPDTMIKTLTAL